MVRRSPKKLTSCIARFIGHHYAELKPYLSPKPEARQLQSYCTARRKLVNERTARTNQLLEVLKHYYSEALRIMQEIAYRPINLALLRKWPTAQSLKSARRSTLEKFFTAHGSRSAARMKIRLEVVETMRPLTENAAIIESCVMELESLLDQIEVLNSSILRYDKVI